MTVLAAIAALAATLGALAYLAATDPKRRRVFGLPPLTGRRRVALALIAAFLPGALLVAFGNSAGFVVWLGAVTIAGWGVAALSPEQGARILAWLSRTAARDRAGLAGAAIHVADTWRTLAADVSAWRDAPRRIAALERRVGDLEFQLAQYKAAEGAGPCRHDAPPPSPWLAAASSGP